MPDFAVYTLSSSTFVFFAKALTNEQQAGLPKNQSIKTAIANSQPGLIVAATVRRAPDAALAGRADRSIELSAAFLMFAYVR